MFTKENFYNDKFKIKISKVKIARIFRMVDWRHYYEISAKRAGFIGTIFNIWIGGGFYSNREEAISRANDLLADGFIDITDNISHVEISFKVERNSN